METTKQNGPQPRIVIIGGGIAGLSAAWQIRQMQGQHAVHCTVLEADERWGGNERESVVPSIIEIEGLAPVVDETQE